MAIGEGIPSRPSRRVRRTLRRTCGRRGSRSSARERCGPRSPSSAPRSSSRPRCTSRRGRPPGARRRGGRPDAWRRARRVCRRRTARRRPGDRDPVRAVDGPGQPRSSRTPRRRGRPQVVEAEKLLRGAHHIRPCARQVSGRSRRDRAPRDLRPETDLGAVRELRAPCRDDERGGERRPELPRAHPARIAAPIERARLVGDGDLRPAGQAHEHAHGLAVEHLRRHVPDEAPGARWW